MMIKANVFTCNHIALLLGLSMPLLITITSTSTSASTSTTIARTSSAAATLLLPLLDRLPPAYYLISTPYTLLPTIYYVYLHF